MNDRAVILGAGVVGCSAAGYLVRPGRKEEVVLDRELLFDPAMGQMRRMWGQESGDVAK